MIQLKRPRWLQLQYAYTNILDRQRARGLLLLIAGMIPFWGVLVLLTLAQASTGEIQPGFLSNVLATITVPFFMVLVHALVQRGRIALASWVVVSLLVAFTITMVQYGLYQSFVIHLVTALVTAGLLLERRGVLVVLPLLITATMLGAIIQSTLTNDIIINPAQQWLFDFAGVVISLLLIGLLLVVFGGQARRLVAQLSVTTEQFKRAGQFLNRQDMTDDAALFQQALIFIREELGYGLVQIYVADESGTLVRRIRPGVNTRSDDLLTQVRVPDASALNDAALRRRSLLISAADPELRRGHLLVATGHALEVPLVWRNVLVGVLDIQTTDEPFLPDDIALFENLAGQLAALVTLRRAEETLRSSLLEQSKLLDGLRRQLRDLRQIERQAVTATWEEYLGGRGQQQAVGFDIDNRTEQVTPAYDLPWMLSDSLRSGQLQVTQSGESQIVNVPILLRGEVLGAMAFTLPPGQILTERQLDMAQKVADRLALALENKRLFEQTQAQVTRERTANEATRLLISATDVETVIKLAAENFNTALGAVRTRVQLQPEAFVEAPLQTERGRRGTDEHPPVEEIAEAEQQ